MLPLHGSYTSDPEEELEELGMKLQIMKGEWKSAVKLILMVKLNQEWFLIHAVLIQNNFFWKEITPTVVFRHSVFC